MASYNQPTTGFRYDPNSNTMGDDDTDSDLEFSGILEIYVHHARNIHNICIYENQDVYAKFSLTYNPDETLSTRIINRGGKNPDFNENLTIKITQRDAVLKCEICMLSRARNYMEDQLLGFALVPISEILGKGKVTQDYSLSSTDLFHSPAGTVKLSLDVTTSFPIDKNSFPETSPMSSEIVLDTIEYSQIEFPDVNAATENQQMVSEYFDCLNSRNNSIRLVSFLHLGERVDDSEMKEEDNVQSRSISPNGSIQNSEFLMSSTTTSLSDDRNSSDISIEKNGHIKFESFNSFNESTTTEPNQASNASPDTPTSMKDNETRDGKLRNEEEVTKIDSGQVKFGPAFSAPLGNINIEAEQSAMQQQIVDMYMRSMQQFTESLAKMKLPIDLHKPETEELGDVSNDDNLEVENKKKDGSRVFYGSRAFF
ncbi:hypothetical protein ACFE04_005549 [Oxalis oulophora]